MPVLSGSAQNKNGQNVYTYEYSETEGANDIVSTIIANADSKPTINGELKGKQGHVAPQNVERHLERGGRVIVMAECAGVRLKISIEKERAIAIPEDGDQETADMLLDAHAPGAFDDDDDAILAEEEELPPFEDVYDDADDEPMAPARYDDDDEFVDDDDEFVDEDDEPFYDEPAPLRHTRGESKHQMESLDSDSANIPRNMNPNMAAEPPIGVGKWILFLILASIPIVNIVFLVIIGLKGKNKTQKNWALAQLILCILAAIISAAMLFLTGGSLLSLSNGSGTSSSSENTPIENNINEIKDGSASNAAANANANANTANDAGNTNNTSPNRNQNQNDTPLPSDPNANDLNTGNSSTPVPQDPNAEPQPPVPTPTPDPLNQTASMMVTLNDDAPIVETEDGKAYFIAEYTITNTGTVPFNTATDIIYEATLNGVPAAFEDPGEIYPLDTTNYNMDVPAGSSVTLEQAWVLDGTGRFVLTAKNAFTQENILQANFNV